jgi:hypothetical protein
MAIAMQVNGDPNAKAADVVVFSVAAAVFTAGAAILYLPAFGAAGATSANGQSQ